MSEEILGYSANNGFKVSKLVFECICFEKNVGAEDDCIVGCCLGNVDVVLYCFGSEFEGKWRSCFGVVFGVVVRAQLVSMCCSSRDEVLGIDSLDSDFVIVVPLRNETVLLQAQASL